MTHTLNIHWFRQDLRLDDNPALTAAAEDAYLLPIYILDDKNAGEFAMGGASRWWLHRSLSALNKRLKGRLRLYRGDARSILRALVQEHSVKAVFWNRCYEPWRIQRDKHIKTELTDLGVASHSHNGSLLWEPWEVLKKDGTPYKVFTPFYRKGCLSAPAPRQPLPEPRLRLKNGDFGEVTIDELALLPSIRWDKQLAPHWSIAEAGAQQRLRDFIEGGLNNYKDGRNFPAQTNTSRLSPHLHFGEISPNQVWHSIHRVGNGADEDCLLSELGWREFSYSLLYHFPELPRKNWQSKFDRFPWSHTTKTLQCWQQGMTGYPIVDAGMRELWQTGFMHNRVRMIVGSFLVKNLLVHWRQGERWFWDCLVDADLASNSASWQWVAGCGADAAPYFRIFNPVTQGEKFDPDGHYTRRFVPELAQMPNKYLYKPWQAPAEILEQAGITLGGTYPKPIVDLKGSRERALSAFKQL